MKSFLKYLLAAVIGSFIALLLIFLVISQAVKGSFRMFEEEEVRVKRNSVLVVDLSKGITDRPGSSGFEWGGFSTTQGLPEYMKAISEAKNDKRIEGILVKTSLFSPDLATLAELRTAITDFKQSGKFVYAFGDHCSQRSYYLASLADSIFMSPVGLFELKGFAARALFFREALEKIGVEMQVFYAGQYKSATEPFRLDKMSEQNREQLRQYISGIYTDYITTVSSSRGLEYAVVDSMARNLAVRNPWQAEEHGLIDAVVYFDEVLEILRSRVGLEDTGKQVPLVSVSKYLDDVEEDKVRKNVIAVVYAEGTIVDGSAMNGSIGGETFAKELRKLRNDKKVKAIVLRINSPGGSAIGSELIWREAVLAGQAKPLIVSMGSLAASGGYFIAAPAGTIVAHPNTLTGSIGVFAIWPNLQKLREEKLGIRYDTVSIGRFADFGNPIRPISEEEAKFFQEEVDRTYRDFIRKVAEGRHMSDSAVERIAQGHIWTGADALELGLVDTLGGLDDAIAIAASQAGLENYSVKAYPEEESPLDQLRQFLGSESLAPEWLDSEWVEIIRQLNILASQRGVMARMAWDLRVE